MSYRLDGKVSIITGSSAGLGEATALHFAKLGASVTLCGRNEQRLEAVRQKCVEASGGKAERFLTVQGDVGETEVRNRIVDETVAKFGQLDILIANHGGGDFKGGFEELTEETFDTVYNTNIKSTIFLCQRAAPHLIKTKGNIVTVSSITSTIPVPTSVAYPTAKAALDHFSRTLAVIMGPKGVRVNNIRPGVFETEAFRNFKGDKDAFLGAMAERIPMRRIGINHEIAEALSFLVSDNVKYITGAELVVDGAAMHANALAMSPVAKK